MYFLTYFLLIVLFSTTHQQELAQLRNLHNPKQFNNNQVKHLAELSNVSHVNELLDNILVPRVVGTQSHKNVFNYITEELHKLEWNVEIDEFKEKTPNFGSLTFKNIIGTLNPNAERYLVLACHYDSKYFENEIFYAATDSAVPCAMMLNLITVMKNELTDIKTKTDVSLKLIFFDGEEAFLQWGPKDSIYGARHLAKRMHQSYKRTELGDMVTELDRIDVLVLLDLIGTPDPTFYSFFKDTERWYAKLCDAEEKLATMDLLSKYSNNNYQRYFKRRSTPSYIEDDHVPFLRRGVPILHLIPNPFPKVWHTLADNREAIDMNTIENINKILRIFVAEYLHVSILDKPEAEEHHKEL